jgi:Uncharacterized proteins of the AP superfamily
VLLPEYGVRSLAEVLPAALRAMGLPAPAAAEGALALPPTRAVVVLLVDGLGAQLLRDHAADAPFLSAMTDAGPLTVGFPSSTPISLTSLGTGVPPGAHGMLGVSFRAPHGELLDSLHWTSAGDPEPADMLHVEPPEDLQPRMTMFERAEAAGAAVTVVSKREFRGTGLTRAALRGGRFRGTWALGDLVAGILAAVDVPGPALCYGYTADLDGLGHAHGPGSLAWRMQLRQVDRLAADVAEVLPAGSTLLVTGDHGMVTAGARYDADSDRDLQHGVEMLGGDPRARHVYVREGALPDVLAAWRSVLGDDAWVVPGEQAIEEGWFGHVPDGMRERIGDVVAAMRGDAVVVRSDAEPVLAELPGQHGSLTPAEQLVPLLVHTNP